MKRIIKYLTDREAKLNHQVARTFPWKKKTKITPASLATVVRNPRPDCWTRNEEACIYSPAHPTPASSLIQYNCSPTFNICPSSGYSSRIFLNCWMRVGWIKSNPSSSSSTSTVGESIKAVVSHRLNYYQITAEQYHPRAYIWIPWKTNEQKKQRRKTNIKWQNVLNQHHF